MTTHTPFINREHELARIQTLVEQWGTQHVLCINAPRGIGKTHLLNEVHQRCIMYSDSAARIQCTGIIDFDDPNLHLRHMIGLKIAQMLDPYSFAAYLQALQDWRRMSLVSVSSERLTTQIDEIDKAFISCFNSISMQKRAILFLDTTDALIEIDIRNYLISLLPHLRNTLTLLAGRDTRIFASDLQATLYESVDVLELPSLLTWFRETHQPPATTDEHFDRELVRKLLILARGQAIFIDFATTEHIETIGADWLLSEQSEKLQTLSRLQFQQRQRQFIRQLVDHFANKYAPLDWVILIMACIYPLDVEMIALLLAVPQNRARELFEQVSDYRFVKRLPGERIALHEEMRHLINDYVWPEIDPTGDRQRRDSLLTVEYLEREIAALTEQRNQLLAIEQRAVEIDQTPEAFSAFLQPDLLEHKCWERKEQLLYHTLFVDLDAGVTTFTRLFEEATYAYRFSTRETLLVQMEQYIHRFTSLQRYEVDSRRVKHLFDVGYYLQAGLLATEMLEMQSLPPEQQVDMLIQRGSAEVRSGHLEQSMADFEQAIQICNAHQLPHSLVRALNARGWSYRHHGNFDQALTDYLEAYQRSVELDDMPQAAWILNNMGFANAFIGNLQQAFENCWTALAIWEEYNVPRGIGAAYSTLGEIYRRSDQVADAINAYSHALDILTSENDVEWLSIVRCGRASILWVQGELEQAEEDLRWSWKHGPQSLKSSILFYEAQLLWVKGEPEQANHYLQQCKKMCQQVGDQFFDFASFSAFLDLAWVLNTTDQWRDYAHEYREYYAQRTGLVALRQGGSCLRKIGDMAICHGCYDEALAVYQEGLPIITCHEVSRPYTIGDQLKKTRNRVLTRDSVALLNRLGHDLYHFWKDKPELIRQHPEALLTFRQWERMR